jgi:hypothetical protein
MHVACKLAFLVRICQGGWGTVSLFTSNGVSADIKIGTVPQNYLLRLLYGLVSPYLV